MQETTGVAATDKNRDTGNSLRGAGIASAGPHPPIESVMQAAADLWRLNEDRMSTLRKRSIMNDSIEELHGNAEDLLVSMQTMDSAPEREAAAATVLLSERTVYSSVRGTFEDLVHAVLVLLGLSIPFAFVVERLLIGSVNVYKDRLVFDHFHRHFSPSFCQPSRVFRLEDSRHHLPRVRHPCSFRNGDFHHHAEI